MVMKARKDFVVVAYDVADDRRRSKVVKILEKKGVRVNYSVFECMLTHAQYERLRASIGKEIDEDEDRVVYYPICLDCYAHIIYQPDKQPSHKTITVI